MNSQIKEKYGIHRKDPRFSDNVKNNIENNSFLSKYNTGSLKINDWEQFTSIITEIFEEVKVI